MSEETVRGVMSPMCHLTAQRAQDAREQMQWGPWLIAKMQVHLAGFPMAGAALALEVGEVVKYPFQSLGLKAFTTPALFLAANHPTRKIHTDIHSFSNLATIIGLVLSTIFHLLGVLFPETNLYFQAKLGFFDNTRPVRTVVSVTVELDAERRAKTEAVAKVGQQAAELIAARQELVAKSAPSENERKFQQEATQLRARVQYLESITSSIASLEDLCPTKDDADKRHLVMRIHSLISSLRLTNEQLVSEVTLLRSVKALASASADGEEITAAKEQVVKAVREATTDLSQKLEQVSKEIQGVRAELANKVAALAKAEQDIKDKVQALEQAEEKVNALTAELATKSSEKATEAEANDKLAREKADLTTRLQAAEDAKVQAQAALGQAQADLKTAQADLKSAQDAKAAFEQQVQKLNADLATLQQRVQQAEAKLASETQRADTAETARKILADAAAGEKARIDDAVRLQTATLTRELEMANKVKETAQQGKAEAETWSGMLAAKVDQDVRAQLKLQFDQARKVGAGSPASPAKPVAAAAAAGAQ